MASPRWPETTLPAVVRFVKRDRASLGSGIIGRVLRRRRLPRPAPILAAVLAWLASGCGERNPAEAIANRCVACHAEPVKHWRYGGHAALTCATCHSIEHDHVHAGTTPVVPGSDACVSCHAFGGEDPLATHLRAVERTHRIEIDRQKLAKGCIACHDAHTTMR